MLSMVLITRKKLRNPRLSTSMDFQVGITILVSAKSRSQKSLSTFPIPYFLEGSFFGEFPIASLVNLALTK
jgi:hypothetical protein